MHTQRIKFILFSIALLLTSLVFSDCKKEQDLREPFIPLIDPEEEPDRLGRNLGINGEIEEGGLPQAIGTAAISITNAQASAKVSKGSKLYVPFTYQADLTISGVYLQVTGAEHYWKTPVDIVPVGNSYVFSVIIPDRVLEGQFNFQYAVYDDDGNISYPKSMRTVVANVEAVCNGVDRYHEEGEEGLTVRRMELGDVAGIVEVEYYMYSLPDRLDIWYDGAWVASTDTVLLASNAAPPSSVCYDGTPGYVSNGNVLTFEYDPGRSKEFFIYMYGCFGATLWDFWVKCPSAGSDNCQEEKPANSIFEADETYKYKLNSAEPQISSLYVQQGDYIFISATGIGSIGKNIIGSPLVVGPEGNELWNGQITRRWTNYDAGQLIVELGNLKYACDNYTLKGRDCNNLPDEFAADNVAFFGEMGNYFVAQSSGYLRFELNDENLLDNIGAFDVEIYRLTKEQHQSRNCFNKCPQSEPTGIDDYQARDNMNYLWKEREDLGWLVPGAIDEYLDDQLENCWHGGFEDYRGLDGEVGGCQCIYDDNGNLVNDASLFIGSYDYGYRFDAENRRLHFILDVFPHIAYWIDNPGFFYNPTPEGNIY